MTPDEELRTAERAYLLDTSDQVAAARIHALRTRAAIARNEQDLAAQRAAKRVVCTTCDGLGGRPSRYSPGYTRLPDGRLSGWTMGGQKDCEPCGGTGFLPLDETTCHCGMLMREHTITDSCTSPRAMLCTRCETDGPPKTGTCDTCGARA